MLLFNETVACGDFFAELPVGQDHLAQGVTKHGPAFLQVAAHHSAGMVVAPGRTESPTQSYNERRVGAENRIFWWHDVDGCGTVSPRWQAL